MSEPKVIQQTVPGPWWTLAAVFTELAPLSLQSWVHPPIRRPNDIEPLEYVAVPTRTLDGCIFDLYATAYNEGQVAERRSLGQISFAGNDEETTIAITPATKRDAAYWREISRSMARIATHVRRYRRAAIGQTFTEILDDYYQRKAHGESPNLREMARAAGVKYGSLRQAKIRYDQKRRA